MFSMIHTAGKEIREGKKLPRDLLDSCLANIDRWEEKVRAWVSVDSDRARAQADVLGEELKRGYWRGPLHGIPLGIKDIFDVSDWPTAAGSALWAKSIAREDSAVVAKLRHAGAVFMGKTVTTQFASFDPPLTRNPWNLNRTPGGSSSGSAAAVACGMCMGAMGSQTGGSITRPASFCGVSGLKPTYGRVSCRGVVPLAFSMDHPGPIAHNILDLALLFQVVAGYDSRDPYSRDRPVADMVRALQGPSSSPRLGRLGGMFADCAEPEMADLMDVCGRKFSEHGAVMMDLALPGEFNEVTANHRTVMAVESASFHQERLRRHPEDYQPKICSLLEEGLACPSARYARCKEHQQMLTKLLGSCFADVNVLWMPATTGEAPDAASTGDPIFNSPWSYTGFPTISFPAGLSRVGLPLAIQLVGLPWKEAELLKVAAWCEKTLGPFEMVPPP